MVYSEYTLNTPKLPPIDKEVRWTGSAELWIKEGKIPVLAKCKNCGCLFWSATVVKSGPTLPCFCSGRCAGQWNGKQQRKKAQYSRYSIFQRDDFQCIYCGKTSYKDRRHMQLDHIVPLNYGGEGIASNLATACKHCNVSKNGHRLPPLAESKILNEIQRRNEERGIPQDRRIRGTNNPNGEYDPRETKEESNERAI